jgi:hypothetical protein
MEIRSYRNVFDLERRIYRVDRLRLNPGGIPVRGVVYCLATLALAVIAGHLPLVASVAGALPWYLRELALPVASAAALTVIRIEGRPFHLAAAALIRHHCGGRRFAELHPNGWSLCSPRGARWHPDGLLILPDGSDGTMRRLRYTGPGAVLVTVVHRREASPNGVRGLLGCAPRLCVTQLPDARALEPAQVIVLEQPTQLLVR